MSFGRRLLPSVVSVLLSCWLYPAGTAQAAADTAQPAAAKQPAAAASSSDEEALARLKPVVAIAGAWLQRPELRRSYVGLEVMDIPSGRVLFSHNGDHRFVTASIAKVFTTACAFDTIGGAYRYSTGLAAFGDMRNGRLDGWLGIVSSQDPSFSYQDLRDLVAALKGRLKSISGDVFATSVPGGGDHFSVEWLLQDWGQDWMPVSSDLVVDRNVVPARDPGRGYTFSTLSADQASSALVKSLLQSPWSPAWVEFDKPTNTVIYFRPSQPITGGFTVANPNDFNIAVAKLMLKAEGIKVEAKQPHIPTTNVLLCEHQSKPLSELIRFCLKESDNLYAQQILRTIGLVVPVKKTVANESLEDRGLARLNAWLESCGVPASDAVLYDGCGLSRKNAITPHAFNLVLQHMAGPAGDGPYIDLLKHDGDDERSSFRYKTGAMDSVRSISGVVKTSTGRPLAVTAIVNDHLPQVRELRASLTGLIKQIETLGEINLMPSARAATPHNNGQPGHRRRRRGG